MDDKLPEIFWFLFWVGFVILAFRMAYLGGKSGYDVQMRALDILKTYAEKGAEPPPAILEQLGRQVLAKPPLRSKQEDSGGFLMTFVGFLFMACVSWGAREWLATSDFAPWTVIAAAAAMAFFGFGAFGFLLAALFSRKK